MRVVKAMSSSHLLEDQAGLKVYEEYEGYELHEVYESHEGFEPHEVHEDHQGYEDDSQALTAALHVIVSVWMLLRALTPKTSSVRGHSRPFSQALTAASRQIQSHAMLLSVLANHPHSP